MKWISLLFLFLFSNLSAQTVDHIESLFLELDSIENHAINKEFPEFSFTSITGDAITEDKLLGKVTLINFWFKSCAPCVAELDALNNLHQNLDANSQFQLISFCADPIEVTTESVLKYNIPYTVCPVSRDECYRLNFNKGFPTNIIVDGSGKIIYFKSGGAIDQNVISKEFLNMQKIIEKEIHEKEVDL